LEGRGDTSAEAIDNRINIALRELEERKNYTWDLTLVNNNLDQCYEDFCRWAGVKQ
jgi:guanylate kinase